MTIADGVLFGIGFTLGTIAVREVFTFLLLSAAKILKKTTDKE